MANHASARKMVRSTERKTKANKQARSHMRTLIKKFLVAISQKNQEAQQDFRAVQACVARAGQKGLIHRGKASRVIGRMALKLQAL